MIFILVRLEVSPLTQAHSLAPRPTASHPGPQPRTQAPSLVAEPLAPSLGLIEPLGLE